MKPNLRVDWVRRNCEIGIAKSFNPHKLRKYSYRGSSLRQLMYPSFSVLSLLADWLERYGLLEDDPQLIPKLLWFLSRIYDTAKPEIAQEHIAPSLEQVRIEHWISNAPYWLGIFKVFCFQKLPTEFPNPTRPRWHRKVSLAFLPIPEKEIAEQLTLHNSGLYCKIRPRECLAWLETGHHIGAVRNLSAFLTNSKRIQNWVKYSILREDRRIQRAHTIDRWVRIAQVSRIVSADLMNLIFL
jgi:son of sevenless-like protein